MDFYMTDRGGLNELALFAGAGGGLLGSHLLGWRTLCAVELDPSAAAVLIRRQNDGILPPFPIWDDVRTFDGKPWRGLIDEVSGGFPCTDIAICGSGAGLDGEASGLWLEMRRIIAEVRPRYAFVENSAMLTSRRLGRVLGDLAEMGSMHDGECSVHMMPGWVTDVNGSGLWPTPTVSDEKGSVTPETARNEPRTPHEGFASRNI
jgi:site-specific DNA-cytosine methylase